MEIIKEQNARQLQLIHTLNHPPMTDLIKTKKRSSIIRFLIPFFLITLSIFILACNPTSTSNSAYKSPYKPIVKKLFNSGNWQESIDIAKIELQHPSINEDDQLFYLLMLSENYRYAENYALSEEYCRQIVSHPKSSEFPKYLGAAYYGLGDLYYLKWGYFKEEDALNDAVNYLDSSLMYAERSNDLALVSKNLYRSGSILQIQGDKENSIENFKKGLEISFSIADTAGIIRNDIHKAADLERFGKLDSALFHYSRAYEYAKQLNRNYSETHALCNLGIYHFDLSKLEIAEDYFNKAKFLAEELNHGIVLCRSYYYISRLNLEYEKKDLAKTYYEKGLAIAKNKGYKNYENAYIELGKQIKE